MKTCFRLRQRLALCLALWFTGCVEITGLAQLPGSFEASVILTDAGYPLRHNDFITNGTDYFWIMNDGITAAALTRVDPSQLDLFTLAAGVPTESSTGEADATEVAGMGATKTYNCIAYAAKERGNDPAGKAGLGPPKKPKWLEPYTSKQKLVGILRNPDGSIAGALVAYDDPVDEAKKLLDDNKWTKVAENAAQPGNIVRYINTSDDTDGKKVTQHFAVVTKTAGGKVTEIRSKWGQTPAYDGKPVDVPAVYGEIEGYYTGGTLLKDPGAIVDLSLFAGIPAVTLKTNLPMPKISETPFARFELVSIQGHTWAYALALPDQNLEVNAGDKLTLYAQGIIPSSALVTNDAASSLFGGWVVSVAETTSNHVTFVATSNATLTNNVSGFQFGDVLGRIGQAVYREEVAGSMGVTLGPSALPISLRIRASGTSLVLTWPFGTLLEANQVSGPWSTNGASSPYVTPATAARKFYRVQLY